MYSGDNVLNKIICTICTKTENNFVLFRSIKSHLSLFIYIKMVNYQRLFIFLLWHIVPFMIFTLKVRDLINFDTNKLTSAFSFTNSPSLGFVILLLLNMLNNVNFKLTKTIKKKALCRYIYFIYYLSRFFRTAIYKSVIEIYIEYMEYKFIYRYFQEKKILIYNNILSDSLTCISLSCVIQH